MSSSFLATEPPTPCHVPVAGQPAWDLALLYPLQGQWSQEEYLELTDSTNWLIEFTDGRIEVLPIPTIEHQLILKYLLRIVDDFVEQRRLGVVLCAPTRVYLTPEKFREPDIVFNFAAKHARSGKRYYQSADLVMEIVSEDDASRARDCEKKPVDYAAGGISEYWIVDPQKKQITVLTLHDGAYRPLGVFGEGASAGSKLLEGFSLDVSAVFRAGQA
jgi:Uma2 family endonuclease